MRLVALALVLPPVAVLVEFAALLGVAQLVGMGWALLFLLVTSVIGVLLVRRVGARAWRRFRAALDEGRAPGQEATDGLIALTGGLLIAFPGFLTDLLGAALFLPPVRAAVGAMAQRAAGRRLSPEVVGQMFGPRKVRVQQPPAGAAQPGTPLEGEIVEPGQPSGPHR